MRLNDRSAATIVYTTLSAEEQQQILQLQQDLLESVAHGGEPRALIEQICLLAEQLLPNAVGTVLLLDEAREFLHVYAAPSVPPEGVERLNRLRPGPDGGSCGNAVFHKAPQFVENTFTDPRWKALRNFAYDFNLCACWSMPIVSPNARIIGSFALASFEHRSPSDFHRKILEISASIVGIVLEQSNAQEALRQSEVKFRTLVENSPLGIFRSTAGGRFLEVNHAMARICGFASPESMICEVEDIGEQIYVDPEDRQRVVTDLLEGGSDVVQFVNRHRRKSGSEFLANITMKVVRDAEGKAIFFDGIVEDVTAQKRAEEEQERLRMQLIQAMKMESIGRLAGGIAHDFNNMLGVIIAHSDLALDSGVENTAINMHLQEIRNAADHSANLTRQLLTFASKQTALPKVLKPNQAVEGMLKMLQCMISEDISLEWRPGKEVWSVLVDPSQLDQILANLCVNARDAIEGSGRISIETANMTLGADDCTRHHPGSEPGDYVRLSVSDSGNGMDADTMAKIFEPFYTTKDDYGTGLGLSTVYGILQKNKGFIDVKSALGEGTTFHIYLPRQHGTSPEAGIETEDESLMRGDEHILLVEDEPTILSVAKSILENCGYTVLSAQSPEEAMRIAQGHAGKIHMLVTDLIMPGKNGRELSEDLLASDPNMRCLYMSGYSDDIITDLSELGPGAHFIQKPFTMASLTAKVREVLDI